MVVEHTVLWVGQACAFAKKRDAEVKMLLSERMAILSESTNLKNEFSI